MLVFDDDANNGKCTNTVKVDHVFDFLFMM